ncbi:hypothetical protein QJC37_005021 [Salmonella enterica]|nr:hypothetical protein [Salmonella enterica]
MDEVQDIIKTCNDPILVLPQNGYANKLVYTSLSASTRIQCGTDGATAMRPYITMQNATAPTGATINATVTSTPVGTHTDNASVDAGAPGTNKKFSAGAALHVQIARTGGVRYDGNVFIVKGQPNYPFANATENGHPAASYRLNGVSLRLADAPSPATGGYRYDTGAHDVFFMRYNPTAGRMEIASDTLVSITGTYDVTSDASGAHATVGQMQAAVKYESGTTAIGRVDAVVVADATDVGSCGAGSISRILASAPGQTAYTCVGLDGIALSPEALGKVTADDLFGSATHPALSGVWRFYMDVQ